MLNKIRVFSTKIWSFFSKIRLRKGDAKQQNSSKVGKILKVVFVFLVIVAGLSQVVFGSMIYFAQANDKVTKIISKYMPFPAVYTSNGVVTVSNYYHEMDYINHFYSATDQSGVDQQTLSEQVMLQLIENKIISEEAAKFKIRISDEEIDDVLKSIISENGGEEEVNKVLNDLYGLSQKEFRKLIKVQLLREKFNNEALTKVKARHILVRLEEGADEAVTNAAKEKIDGYLAEIKGGLDFAEAAKKYSEDVGSNEQGGDLGYFGRGEMVEEFEKTAFDTAVGEISEPFRTSFGWHIVKVEEKKGEIDQSFESWLSDLKGKTIIIQLFKTNS